MAVILGIDLGTSSIKAMLLDLEKGVVAIKAKTYDVEIPQKGYAEQNPQVWWTSLVEVLHYLREHHRSAYENIAAVGYSGQMHGLVLTDQNGSPVRPAILWLDQRAKSQLAEIHANITETEMGAAFCNRVSSGFAFPSLLWVKENEPEIFSKVRHALCPKDYLRQKMTGETGAEVSDASSTGIFSTTKRDWAWDIIEKFGLPKEIFPKASESEEIAGFISRACAQETGLPKKIPVVFGSGDQPAQSIGNGVIQKGKLICNIGTGGQISGFAEVPVYDKQLRTNTFCHAVRGAYTIFGAALCSGMSLSWAKNKVLHVPDYGTVNTMVAQTAPGADGLLYLPYLTGERTPHMNPDAKGMFFGMVLGHEEKHFLRAVMEGVTYSLKDCLGLLQELGADAPIIIASGGATASDVWLQIQADILEKPVCASRVKEQACLGSCLLAAAGAHLLSSLQEGCERFVTMDDRIFYPNPEHQSLYQEGYAKYRELYQRVKDLM